MSQLFFRFLLPSTRVREFIKVAKDLEVKEIRDGVAMGGEETVDEMEEAHPEETENQVRETKLRQRQPRKQISSDNNSAQCPECGAGFTRKGSMMEHYRSKHEGIKYPCNQCDYQATTQSNLQTHIQSKHEGIKYPCNQCDYKATT